MKYTNDDFEVMAGRYVAENLDTTSIPYEHGFIKGFVAECIHLQNLQQTDVEPNPRTSGNNNRESFCNLSL